MNVLFELSQRDALPHRDAIAHHVKVGLRSRRPSRPQFFMYASRMLHSRGIVQSKTSAPAGTSRVSNARCDLISASVRRTPSPVMLRLGIFWRRKRKFLRPHPSEELFPLVPLRLNAVACPRRHGAQSFGDVRIEALLLRNDRVACRRTAWSEAGGMLGRRVNATSTGVPRRRRLPGRSPSAAPSGSSQAIQRDQPVPRTYA